jgi:hypothetical protein
MKTPNFLEGAAVALAASVAAAVLFGVLAPVFGGDAVLRALIALLALVYVIYLLRRSRERVGRVSVIAGWCLAALVLAVWHPPLLLYLVLHVGMLWLVRALYHYASVLSALADLGLNGVALAAAVWAATHTASLLVSTWCFFLLQALFVAIPRDLRATQDAPTDPADRFQQAHRAAQAALRKLSSVR